jgi:hypothetical protein
VKNEVAVAVSVQRSNGALSILVTHECDESVALQSFESASDVEWFDETRAPRYTMVRNTAITIQHKGNHVRQRKALKPSRINFDLSWLNVVHFITPCVPSWPVQSTDQHPTQHKSTTNDQKMMRSIETRE